MFLLLFLFYTYFFYWRFSYSISLSMTFTFFAIIPFAAFVVVVFSLLYFCCCFLFCEFVSFCVEKYFIELLTWQKVRVSSLTLTASTAVPPLCHRCHYLLPIKYKYYLLKSTKVNYLSRVVFKLHCEKKF